MYNQDFFTSPTHPNEEMLLRNKDTIMYKTEKFYNRTQMKKERVEKYEKYEKLIV